MNRRPRSLRALHCLALVAAMALGPGSPREAAAADWSMCGAFPMPPRPAFDFAPAEDPRVTRISANEADRDDEGITTLTGEVQIQRGTRQAKADFVRWDEEAEHLRARGNVRIWDEGLYLSGDLGQAFLPQDLTRMDSEAEGRVDFLVEEAHGRGHASELTLSGEDVLRGRDVFYTTCDPDDEVWRLRARRLTLDREADVGTANHAWITFKRVPIFYSPYLTFPLSDRRRTGFLAPSYRVSNASGLELTVPYYLNLAPNYDATVGLRAMTERGVQLQGEFRYLTTRGQGQLGLELLPDDRKFGSGRSAVSFQHTGYFAERWSADVNFNRLSDRQYFEDLGTNLAIASQTFVERRADVYRWGNGWYALGRLQSFQTLDRRLPGGSRPYERLPQLLAAYRPAERNRQVNFSGTAELVHFDRRDSVTGVRMDLRPTVSYPIRGTAGFIEPRATLRQTLYSLDGTAPGAKRTPTRTIPTFSVDSGLFFERNLEIAGQSLVQTLEPRAFYLFTPPTNQDDLPVFDTGRFTFAFAQLFREDRFSGADRVGDAHQVALALTSRVLDPAGGELVRGSVGQILFLRDRRITLPGQARETDSVSNLVGEVSANLGRRWRVLGGLQWDPHATRTERSTVAVRYQPDPLRVVNAAYRFLRQAPGVVGSVEQMDLSFAWPVARHWRAVGRWNHSLPDNRMLEAFGGLEYESCCWAFRAVGRRYLSSTEGEHTNAIFFQLELKGLTGIGRGTVSFLERSIPGYENPF